MALTNPIFFKKTKKSEIPNTTEDADITTGLNGATGQVLNLNGADEITTGDGKIYFRGKKFIQGASDNQVKYLNKKIDALADAGNVSISGGGTLYRLNYLTGSTPVNTTTSNIKFLFTGNGSGETASNKVVLTNCSYMINYQANEYTGKIENQTGTSSSYQLTYTLTGIPTYMNTSVNCSNTGTVQSLNTDYGVSKTIANGSNTLKYNVYNPVIYFASDNTPDQYHASNTVTPLSDIYFVNKTSMTGWASLSWGNTQSGWSVAGKYLYFGIPVYEGSYTSADSILNLGYAPTNLLSANMLISGALFDSFASKTESDPSGSWKFVKRISITKGGQPLLYHIFGCPVQNGAATTTLYFK